MMLISFLFLSFNAKNSYRRTDIPAYIHGIVQVLSPFTVRGWTLDVSF